MSFNDESISSTVLYIIYYKGMNIGGYHFGKLVLRPMFCTGNNHHLCCWQLSVQLKPVLGWETDLMIAGNNKNGNGCSS